MLKKQSTLFLLVPLIFLGILFFNQRWILLNFPFKDFTSIGQIYDMGYISSLLAVTGRHFYSLPKCPNPYSNEGSVRFKFFLESTSINLQEFTNKPVKVWGKIRVTSKSKYNPNVIRVCDPRPCGAEIVRIMTVDRVEIDTSPLLPCQQDYLEEMANRS